MDFLDPKNKRSYNIRLAIGFTLTALIITLGAWMLTLITSGYSFNTKTGQVVQNGLVYINSKPAGASVYLNHKYYSKTNVKAELVSGNYQISIYNPGYNTWENSFSLEGGTVEDLTYPFLFPLKPEITTVATLSTKPQIFTQSPDRKYLLTTNELANNSFDIIDQTNLQTPIATVSIPSNLLVNSTNPNNFTVIDWSSDAQHILLSDTYGATTNYIVFNFLNSADSYNVNQTYSSTPFTSVDFLNKDYSQLTLFNQTTGDLYFANLSTKLATLVLSSVTKYTTSGTNQILYATADPTNQSMESIRLYNLTNNYLVKNVGVTTNYILDISSYGGNYYYTIGGSSLYDYIYENILSSNLNSKQVPLPFTLMVNNVQALNVVNSPNQRYVALQSGNNFSIYDIFSQNHYDYQLGQNLTDPNFAVWMDNDHLASFSDGQMVAFDFDGTNLVKVTSADSSFEPLFNNNYSGVYYLQMTSSGSWSLDRAGLIYNQP